jgi:hypothetical protein
MSKFNGLDAAKGDTLADTKAGPAGPGFGLSIAA